MLCSPFIFGLYSTDPASPALSTGLSQGLVLDPSLKILSVVASLSLPLLTASHLKLASLCSHQKAHVSVVTQPSPGGSVLLFSVSAFPFLPYIPTFPCHRASVQTVISTAVVFCPPPHLHLPSWFLCTLQCLARIFWESICCLARLWVQGTVSVSCRSILVHNSAFIRVSLVCPLLNCAC